MRTGRSDAACIGDDHELPPTRRCPLRVGQAGTLARHAEPSARSSLGPPVPPVTRAGRPFLLLTLIDPILSCFDILADVRRLNTSSITYHSVKIFLKFGRYPLTSPTPNQCRAPSAASPCTSYEGGGKPFSITARRNFSSKPVVEAYAMLSGYGHTNERHAFPCPGVRSIA